MSQGGLPILVALTLLFAGLIVVELFPAAPPPSLPEIAPRAGHRASQTVPAMPPPPLDAFARTMLARPLFSPDRLPQREAQSAPQDEIVTATPRLTGIMVGPAGRRAIFAPSSGKPIVVGEGASVGDLTVQAISPAGVTVAMPDGTARVLRPSFDPTPPAQNVMPAFALPLQPGRFAQPPAPPPPPPGADTLPTQRSD